MASLPSPGQAPDKLWTQDCFRPGCRGVQGSLSPCQSFISCSNFLLANLLRGLYALPEKAPGHDCRLFPGDSPHSQDSLKRTRFQVLRSTLLAFSFLKLGRRRTTVQTDTGSAAQATGNASPGQAASSTAAGPGQGPLQGERNVFVDEEERVRPGQSRQPGQAGQQGTRAESDQGRRVSGEHLEGHSGDLPDRGFVLTGQRLFCTLFLLAAALPLAYMGGVAAGRYSLEKEYQELSALPVSPVQEETGTADGGDGSQDESAQGKEEAANLAQGILRPKDLGFVRFLRAAPGEKVPEPGSMQLMKPAVAPQPKDAQAQGTEPVMAPGMSPARVSGGPPEPPAQAADLFDFVFQTAAFRTRDAAENLRMQLEAEGFRSRLETQGRLYLVLLLTRGPITRVGEVHALMQRLRLGVPIERSRRAVLRPIGQR